MARFTLAREVIGNAAGAHGNVADNALKQWRLTDTTTGKFWLQAATAPMTGVSHGNATSNDANIATLIETMLTALAPTA